MSVLERCETPRGELVLRRAGAHLEIVSGGVFLMSTASGGASERLLVRATLAASGARGRVLLGGLGVGFSLVEALGQPGVERVTVVEVEQAVIAWHRTHLRAVTAGALDEERVRVVHADVAAVLEGLAAGGGAAAYDAVCLDVDNGPGWTVTPANDALYGEAGVERLRRAVAPGGAVGVWSAHAAPEFESRLAARFDRVEVHTVPVARGEPDHVYVAR